MINKVSNTKTRAQIKKQFDRYIKNQVSVHKEEPVQVSDQVARELFADFISVQCSPKTKSPEYEQTTATVGVNTGIFRGCVDSDFKPKHRDFMLKKFLASKGITDDQPVTEQIRFSMKGKSKKLQEVLKLAAATGETASIVIASENDGGWGRQAGIFTASKGVGDDIDWTYVDIYQLMDYLTTYHADVAYKYCSDVKHSN